MGAFLLLSWCILSSWSFIHTYALVLRIHITAAAAAAAAAEEVVVEAARPASPFAAFFGGRKQQEQVMRAHVIIHPKTLQLCSALHLQQMVLSVQCGHT
jgi:hypothetical protein